MVAPLAPKPLWNSGRGDYDLSVGYGDGAGSMIWHGCAIGDVYYDPQECFIAVAAPGPHLTDIVVRLDDRGAEWRHAGRQRGHPDLHAGALYAAAGPGVSLGRPVVLDDPFLEVVPAR